jgi:hypothetical protein
MQERERHMLQSHFVYAREIVLAAAEARRECAEMARRSRYEIAEIRAATRKSIIESWELMAEIEAALAKR